MNSTQHPHAVSLATRAEAYYNLYLHFKGQIAQLKEEVKNLQKQKNELLKNLNSTTLNTSIRDKQQLIEDLSKESIKAFTTYGALRQQRSNWLRRQPNSIYGGSKKKKSVKKSVKKTVKKTVKK